MDTTKQKTPLLEKAIFYKVTYGLNIVPLRITKEGKKPTIKKWKKWQNADQSIEEIKKIKWDKVNGIGFVNGKLISLDFDKCTDENFINTIAIELNIDCWIVKTGNGYHMHFYIDELSMIDRIFGEKSYHNFEAKDKTHCDHCELRIKSCYTALPPSIHFTGREYYFLKGEPQNEPSKITAKKLFEVLNKYFVINGKKENAAEKHQDGFYEDFNNGVEEGNRHNTLVKIFGAFYSRGIDKKYLTTMLRDWNNKNRTPLPVNELTKQINDLFNRYDKGLDGIFLQFNNCLLQLQDNYKLKLEKMICYAVIEFDGDKRIIEELKLEEKINEYHNECKKLVKHYEKWTGKRDQIVRIGKTLILDAYRKNFRFEYFCIYVGIVSYLGRNKNNRAKQISHNIIRFRAMGYKNEKEFLLTDSEEKPIKESTIRSGIKKIEDMNLVRSFSLVNGRMKWFSTFIESNEKLAQLVKNYEIKKMHKRNSNNLLKAKMQNEIRSEQERLNELINNKKKIAYASSLYPPSSLHLLSNES